MMTRWFNSLPYVQPFISEFVITVKTDNAGVSASNQILLPIRGTNMVIDWGDGSVSTHTQTGNPNNTIGGNNVLHTYANAGVYKIKISPSITQVSFAFIGDTPKLVELNNWGKAVWRFDGLANSFPSAVNMLYLAKDAPNLSIATNIQSMFLNSFQIDGDFSKWDVSNVQNFNATFRGTKISSDLSQWNMSSATNIGGMFQGAFFFNSNINNWNVSSVTTLSGFVNIANAFNQELSNWVINPNANMSTMLNTNGTTLGMNTENYSRTLIGWANNIFSRGGVVTGRSLGANNRRYNNINYVSGQQFNNAVDARNYLVNTLGWTITGDAQV